MEASTEHGGLKMTNLRTFDKALKISWIKRLNDQNSGWEHFPRKFNIHKIILFGDAYPHTLIQDIDNAFWKDVVIACVQLHEVIANKTNEAYNIPLWFNSKINLSFRASWYQNGYKKLSDILDEDGNILSNMNLNNRGLKINFLDYEKLRYDISKLILPQNRNNMAGPYLPIVLFEIGHNMKGCAKTYNLLMNFNDNIVQDTQRKWEEILIDDIPYNIVKRAFYNLHRMKEGPFTKYLQFKVLHNRIFTNKRLYDIGLIDNSACPYCNEPEETMEHALIYCNTVVEFWNDLERWLRRHIDNSITISNIEKIMGTGTLDNIVDKAIIAAKRVIYTNRQVGKQYSVHDVKKLLKTQMKVEEYISGIEGNNIKFLKTWEVIYGKL